MRPVSAEFLRAVTGSHERIVRARVVAPGQTGTNPTGTEILVLDGDVQLDATADVRSTLDLTTDGNSMWPGTAASLLAPLGNEIFVERGVQYGTGAREWVSLGYHRIRTPEQDDAPNGPIRVNGRDRMSAIVDGRLPNPRQYGANNTYGELVNDLVLDIYPTATIEWDDATNTVAIGRRLVAEEDRYGFLKDLVTSRGKIFYWDHRGVLVIKNMPTGNVPAFTIGYGRDGTLVNAARQLTIEGVYNGVVAFGEAADTVTAVRALVVDDNPYSPTAWGGPFGKVPRFYSSPFITTITQAQSAAAAILRQSLGLPYSVDFTAVPNPALEPYDVGAFSYGGTGVGTEIHMIDRLTIPLKSGPLTGATRQQTAT